MKKICLTLTIFTMLFASIFSIFNVSATENFDYSTALEYSIYFYDANKCGPEAGDDNFFDWRGACHTTDGSEAGLDLTGGFHDAGDHLKFGLPQAYSASILAWSLYEYRDVFDATGNTEKLLSTLKHFTDYFLKCYPESGTFYYQVGSGEIDHTYWGAPEEQTGPRPVPYVADESNPASDVLGLTSAALSKMYLIYKDVDADYANECLQVAKELYEMCKNNPGEYELGAYYSSSSFWDDLAWAATWLYVIENDDSYLTEIDYYLSHNTFLGESPFENKWTMCWDDMYMAVFCKLAELTGDQKYIDAMDYNLDYWMNSLTTTPDGLRHLDVWGALRYASAESMLAMLYYEQTGDESLKEFAKSQIDYALGDNQNNMSYLIGFGENYPECPHHRAANGYTYAGGENSNPAKHLLVGALVGGPDAQGNYVDDVNLFQHTEVAIDYNAAFVGATAAIVRYYGDLTPPEPTPEPDLVRYDVGDINLDGNIDTTDLTLMKRYILEIIDEFPYEDVDNLKIPIADVNGDGFIDTTDYMLMQRYVLELISEFPVEYDIYGNVVER
ncbi:glycoside hydrolase family 9 protein [Herbivorax sp. ANBcel31]|uniref:glycoside hydrolase family 9 protein n=1 Tax=Herbivorax sp. ANBcel31 TaxID=3069754 RepID=UPI0027B59052|nr:glycoside hydrolase family 9 protein [Herbivorax sp. ANBcel31]MDQ2087241.1 glycoside hydrolase family 9 protein [Herbivorax sp. ANBcel31]